MPPLAGAHVHVLIERTGGDCSRAVMQHLQDLGCFGPGGCTCVQHLQAQLITQPVQSALSI